jgi:hypothetical protein
MIVMRREYHYLVAGLPELLFEDKKLLMNSSKFIDMLSDHLPADDMNILRLFLWRYDNINVLIKLENSEKAIERSGNLNKEEIDTILSAVKEDSFDEKVLGVPGYIGKIIEAYRNETPIIPGKKWELQLSELYFEYAISNPNPFISNWFQFERDLNNLLTAAKCKKYKIPVEGQLIGTGDLVEKLFRSSSRDFGLDKEFPYADRILKAIDEDDFLQQEKKIDLVKWDYLDDEVFFYYFTIERIFSFLIKLTIIERWLALDKETGQKLFNELVNNMEASYEFPEEFQLK